MIKLLHKKKLLFVILIILSVFNLQATNASAEKEESGLGFQIQPVFNSNQIEKDLGYYYINGVPSENQNLDLILTNTSDKEIKLKIAIENAISTNYGNLAYSSNKEEFDPSLKNPLTEIVTPSQDLVTLKAKKSEKIQLKVEVPSEEFKGVKMGRVVVKEDKKEDSKQVGPVTNEYEYAVGIILTEDVGAFNDGSVLNIKKVKPKIQNAMRVISAEISAPTPKTVEGLKVRSYVTEKGDNKKIKERNVENFMFAPNSKTSFSIPWGTTNFKPGDYTFYFEASNKIKKFYLKKDFKIENSQANSLNEETAFSVLTSKKDKILLILLNSLLVIIIVYILWRDKRWINKLKIKKKSKKDKKKQKKTKKRKK